MLSSKKSASSSPLTWTFANALLFVGLTLTIVSSSFNIVSVDAQATTSLQEFFPTTEDDGEGAEEDDGEGAEEDDGEGAEEDDGEGAEEDDGEGAPLRIAFVKPSFTYAAYQQNGFYNFYGIARDLPDETTNVTANLNLLTVEVPDEIFTYYRDDPSEGPSTPSQQGYYDMLMELVEEEASSLDLDVEIADISDKEVHHGDIFDSAGNNAYDVLFLFHQEYVTQAEYDNLKKFVVQNGGTIVFNHANNFIAEVNYDSASNTITLVRGHDWAYDGNSAWRTENERWLKENQQWVGSNFMDDTASDDIIFLNNPFNYEHSEEQLVTNPNATIILDFGVVEMNATEVGDEVNRQHYPHPEKVAIYEMISGEGKIIHLSIFSHKLEDNEIFLDFYEEEILPRAFGVPISGI
jgi:hypothetical protein